MDKVEDTKPALFASFRWLRFAAFLLPFGLLFVLGVRWYIEHSKVHGLSDQFLRHQNSMLAQDAVSVASRVSQMLEKATEGVQVLSLLPPTRSAFQSFLQAQRFSPPGVSRGALRDLNAPDLHYNRALFLANDGSKALHWSNGQFLPFSRIEQCLPKKLCDRELMESMRQLPVGTFRIGRAMRWYTSQGARLEDATSSLGVAYRSPRGVYLLGMDFRLFRWMLRTPSFPYTPKRDLLKGYAEGNYIYILNRETDLLAHPKYWHVLGLDKESGKPVAPMRLDADEGRAPLNFLAYEKGRLRSYFDCLLNKSFPKSRVDIFKATNLKGTIRVVSVAPILFDRAQFEEDGFFGHVIVGCALEYFQEPQERVNSYY